MSNIFAVQDNDNNIGLGTTFITVDSNNLSFINDTNTFLEINSSTNKLSVGTVKQSTWQGNIIDTSYGGTGLSGIGTAGQVLSVKSDLSGLEWKNVVASSNSINFESSINIATNAQSTVTIGNINQPLTINTSSDFIINLGNSTPTNNQILGYSDNSVKFIDEVSSSSNIGTVDDLWNLVNYFYPGYKYLLMNLVVKTSTYSENLISFNPTTYNYSIVLLNTFNSIIIIPSVFNDSVIKFSDDTSENLLENYSIVSNNSINTRDLVNPVVSKQVICNFNLKIADNTNNIYTVEIIQKNISVEIKAYRNETDRNTDTNVFSSNNYFNNVIYIKIIISESVENFDSSDITVNNGSISSFSGTGDTYTCILTSNNIQNNTCQIFVQENSTGDSLGNTNIISNIFSFIYDTVHPSMTIKGYSSYDSTNNIFNNADEITHNSTLNANDSATIFIKFESSEDTDDFDENDIEVVKGSITLFQSISSKIYVCQFTCTSGDSSNVCSVSVPENKFSDQATNTNLNVPSNTFSITYDDTLPELTSVTIVSDNTDTTKAVKDDTITLSITASETITTPTISFTIGSTNISPDVSGSGNKAYSASYVVDSDLEGIVSFSIDFTDNAGNSNTTVTQTTNNSSVTVDSKKPTLTSVTIVSDNSTTTKAVEDDTITLSITASETITTPTVSFTIDSTSISPTVSGSGNRL